MSDITENTEDKIFGIDFVLNAICFAIAFLGLGYVLSVLPEIAKDQSKTCIKGGWKYGLIVTHITTFVLIPLAMRIFYQGLRNLGQSAPKIFATQLGLAFIMVSVASEIGWHVTQCWYYEDGFTMLNFMFYFFLLSGFALWADGLSQQITRLTRLMNFVFAFGLLAISILYPLGVTKPESVFEVSIDIATNSNGNPAFKIPIYIFLTLVFSVLTYRGYKLIKDWRMSFVFIFSVIVNLFFVFLLQNFGGEPYYNALFHILHDAAGTLAGVAIFTYLVYQKGIAQKNQNQIEQLTQEV